MPLRKSYQVFISDYSNNEKAIRDWVSEHVLGAHEITMRMYAPADWRVAYLFKLEDDAFRFKLWWG